MKYLKKIKNPLNNKKIVLVTLLFVILSSIFYWYELRPRNIAKKCNQMAIEISTEPPKSDNPYVEKLFNEGEALKEWYDLFYKTCIRAKGL